MIYPLHQTQILIQKLYKMHSPTSIQDHNYYQQLTEANPLHKKQLRKCHSIFPQVQLPTFLFTTQQTQLLHVTKQIINHHMNGEKKNIRSRSVSPKKRSNLLNNFVSTFNLQLTDLNILFQNPLYCFNKRLSKGSNKNFCNIKIFPEQSQEHLPLQDNIETFFQQLKHDNIIIEPQQNLSFQSRFQSGNLAMVTKSSSSINKNQYYLLLTKDLNTARCTQWFFFRVLNRQKYKTTFHILNFFKNYSSFQYGMQICIATKSNNYQWIRGGENILYRKTNIKSDNQKFMYSLSFTYDFTVTKDVTYFAYSFPYTYTQLDRFLFKLEEQHPTIVKRRVIGESLGGNSIDMITITNFKTPSNDKRAIFITARIHSGQTPSSFVIQGIIKKLIQNTQQIQNARQKFIFKLIPMLNPDGVINGNYRCSLSGYDLNRVWNKCDKDKYPQIYYLKKTIQCTKRPFLFIDLHAHSKKKGVFMYGCNIKNNPFLCRQIPFLLWKNIQEFNYYQCNFSVSNKQREGTSRMSMFKQFGVMLSYTMEYSFCGPLKVRKHFTTKSYEGIGQNLILTIEKFYGRRRLQNINDQQFSNVLKQLYQNKQLMKIGQNQVNSSSDSQLEHILEVQLGQQTNQNYFKRTQKINIKSKLILQANTQDIGMRTQRQKFSNNFILTRVSSFREKSDSDFMKILPRRSLWQGISKVGFNPNQIQKNLQQNYKDQISETNKDCYSFANRKQDQNMISKKFIKPQQQNRYQDEVNNLTNLFLPSVTSCSYKKYNKPKTQNKNMVHVGRKFLENAGILKQQIKSVIRRKIQWKSSGKTFL